MVCFFQISTMGLNIKNTEAEQLAAEVASMRPCARGARPEDKIGLREYLETMVWPMILKAELGRAVSRDDEDRILGFGPEGF
jgi:antitoxin VapB